MKKIPLKVPKSIQKIHCALSGLGFIAGGSIASLYQNETPRDIDVFAYRESNYPEIVAKLTSIGFEKKFSNDMLTRQKDKTISIDVVSPRATEFMRTYGEPEEVIQYFDFTVARAALISDNEALVDDLFEDDIKTKRLRIMHIVCPLSSVQRIAKYKAKGYHANVQEIGKLFREFNRRGMEPMLDLLERPNLTIAETAELMKWIYID